MNEALLKAAESLQYLHPNKGGLLGHSTLLVGEAGEPSLQSRVISIGNVRQVYSDLRSTHTQSSPTSTEQVLGNVGSPKELMDGVIGRRRLRHSVSGGTASSDEEATFLARAEGLERYCSHIYDVDLFEIASRADLGSAALDLSLLPRCSTKELDNPRCPVRAPRDTAVMRWVKGVSLLDGRIAYVPAVLVYLGIDEISCEERINVPISTGCAAHTSYEAALLTALLEVIERDLIAVLWLQKLPFPRIQIDSAGEILSQLWAEYSRCAKNLEYVFFDAKTDLGIPIVYGVQIDHGSQRIRTLVSCSAATTFEEALIKAMRDMVPTRRVLASPHAVPNSWEEYSHILDGAAYMARAEVHQEFDFLLKGTEKHRLSDLTGLGSGDVSDHLRLVLHRLRTQGFSVYAVDLTTDEAERVGFKVVRVIVPEMQPLSFNYLARYLATPRLYSLPEKLGYRVLPEKDINPFPQPFA